MNKMERWGRMKEVAIQKKVSQQQVADSLLSKKAQRLEKVTKNYEEGIKDRVDRI
jgi:hypothetical protein